MGSDELYHDEVDVERIVSAIAGKGFEVSSLSKMRKGGGILAAFAHDIDIQEITVVSTNIVMVRRYSKRLIKAKKGESK